MYVLVKCLRIKKRKVMCLLEEVDVLDKLNRGVSTAVVRHHYGVHRSTIKKNECENFLCKV